MLTREGRVLVQTDLLRGHMLLANLINRLYCLVHKFGVLSRISIIRNYLMFLLSLSFAVVD